MKNPAALLVKIGVAMLVVTVAINALTALSEIPFIGIPVVLTISGVALFVAFHVLKKKVKRSLRKAASLFS